MLQIVLEYKDDFTNGEWNKLDCMANSIQEALQSYGLVNGTCEYRIISVVDMATKQKRN